MAWRTVLAMTTTRSEHIGRQPKQLIAGDIAVCPGQEHILGDITIVDGKPFVKWADWPAALPLNGGMVITMRRPGEVLSWES